MSKALKILLLIVLITGGGLALTLMYQNRTEPDDEVETENRPGEKAPLVRTVEVEMDTLEQVAHVTGAIEADYSSEVVAEVGGKLERLRLEDETPVEEGLHVEAGEVLAVVERRHVRAALREAEAGLEEARSSREEAQVRKEDAERGKNRMVALYKKGTVTEQARDKALTAYQGAQAAVDMAEKRIKRAEAAVGSARLRYEDATRKAPINGVISQKFVDEGSYVNKGTPIVKITNMDYVEVKGALAGRHLPLLTAGQTPARVQVDAYPDEIFEGKVGRVQPELHPATRTAMLTVRMPNPDGKLKPGMFARMGVVLRRREDAAVIPDAALVNTDNGYDVFIIDDGRVVRRRVRIGLQVGGRNEILEGLSSGDVVAVRGHHLLEDGLAVEVMEDNR